MTMQLYQTRGRLGAAPLFVPFFVLFGAVVFGGFHGFIHFRAPDNPIISAIALAASLSLGQSLAGLLKRGTYWSKCDNLWFMRVMGLIAGTTALYVSWAVYLTLVSAAQAEFRLFDLLQTAADPAAIWQGILATPMHSSLWRRFVGGMPPAWLPSLLWAFEALLVGAVAAFGSRPDQTLFCESCNRWADQSETLYFHRDDEDDSLTESLEQGRINGLLARDVLADPVDQNYYGLALDWCGGCGETATVVAVKNTHFVDVTDPKIEGSANELDVLTPPMVLSPSDFARLHALL